MLFANESDLDQPMGCAYSGITVHVFCLQDFKNDQTQTHIEDLE